MDKILLVIGTFLFVGINMVSAQNAGWENYGTPEQVNDHVETNDAMWLSTNAGVVQINKNTLVKTYYDRASANLPSNFVEGIAKSSNGDIWIGTYNQAISTFDGTDWTNHSFSQVIGNVSGTVETYCIEVDNQDNVWVGTSEGLLRFDGTNWVQYNEQNVSNSFGDIWALCLDNQGNLFIATNDVFKFDGTTFTNTSATASLTLYGEADLLTDANGDVWVNNSFSTIGKYDGTNWTKYTTSGGELPSASFYTIGNSPTGVVYFTSSDGKYELQNGVWTATTIDSSIPLVATELTTYFYDNQGSEWLANDDELYQKDGATITSIDLKGKELASNEFNAVKSFGNTTYFISDKSLFAFDGSTWTNLNFPILSSSTFFRAIDVEIASVDNIWVLFDEDGLMNWDGTSWTSYTTSNSTIPFNYYEDMAYDAATQTLWLVATNNGLVKYDGSTWTTYNSSNTPIADNDLREITLDDNGNVYTTTAVSAGNIELWRFDGTNWMNLNTGADAVQVAITTIHVDAENSVWAGANGNLIYKYTTAGVESWDLNTLGLPGFSIYNITSDRDGVIYIASYNGAASFDGMDWTAWTMDNSGLSDNKVFDLEIDENDKLWFATEHGISAFQLTPTNTTTALIQNNSLRVFPNPISTTATVTFDLNKATDNIRVKIVSIDGRTIQERLIDGRANIGEQQLEINRNQMASGLYYLTIQTDREQLVKSILIQD